MKKQFTIEITKNENGYVVSDKTNMTVDIFSDNDHDRQKLVSYLVENLLNKEVKSGKKYV